MSSTTLDCRHFAVGECRSCRWLPRPYDDQLAAKHAAAVDLVGAPGDAGGPVWEEPVASRPEGFRNKAKMVVAGTATEPTLGILDPAGRGVDLRDCPLHEPPIVAALPVLADFVTRADLAPYGVGSTAPVSQRGELKHLLVTASPDAELMVRIVLRSTAAEARIRKHLPWLLGALPNVRVVTLNLQPAHRAVLEGEREIVLTDAATLPMRLGGLTLHIGPRSFFQTNTPIAITLYGLAREWTAELDPRHIVDLYCGVGGFALHLAAPGRRVTGVEISADAIAAAERSRDDAGLRSLDLLAGDATALEHAGLLTDADLVVVNPPRRGLGPELVGRLEGSGVPHLLYSSCDPASLARDLARLPSYAPVRARLLDMFPQTPHAEVLMLLAHTRRGGQRSEYVASETPT